MAGAAHKLVAETAKGLAGAFYENMMTVDDEVWAEWKERFPDVPQSKLQDYFVEMSFGRFLGEARATLAAMLRSPIPEALKEQIHEALVLDNDLKGGRTRQIRSPKTMAQR